MVQTGDVVLFQGSTSLFDRAISFFTGSSYTHVAMVIVDPPGLPPGPHVIESSLEPTPDEVSDRYVLGVQMQPLQDALDAHGTATVRALQTSVPSPDFVDRLSEVEKRVNGDSYDVDIGDWLRAELRVMDPNLVWEQQDHSFWCSALVAYLYVKLGLLPDSVPWTLISPKEWGPGGRMESLLINCSLGPPQPIENDRLRIRIPPVLPDVSSQGPRAPRARDARRRGGLDNL